MKMKANTINIEKKESVKGYHDMIWAPELKLAI